MKSVIHKQQIASIGLNRYKVPLGAKVLSAGVQFGEIFFWYNRPQESARDIEVDLWAIPTGGLFDFNDRNARFLNTVILDGGNFVMHIFVED